VQTPEFQRVVGQRLEEDLDGGQTERHLEQDPHLGRLQRNANPQRPIGRRHRVYLVFRFQLHDEETDQDAGALAEIAMRHLQSGRRLRRKDQDGYRFRRAKGDQICRLFGWFAVYGWSFQTRFGTWSEERKRRCFGKRNVGARLFEETVGER
jgi:hypothetical protein